MPMREYPKTEKYQIGDKVLALLLEVRDTDSGGAEVILSRSSPEFVRELIKQEVPEVNDGTIIIDKIVREPGYRTKVTVRSTDFKVDPVGACVGMRGNRVKNVIRELNNEKIDFIVYSADPVELLQNALSPIEIRKINLSEEDKTISIVVEDEDFAAVIGKKGMNARLNSRLIDYELEAHRMSDYKRISDLERGEQLAALDDASLDAPLQPVEGISSLIFDCLAERYTSLRALLQASSEELASIPGISREIVDKILEQIRKQRN